MDDPRLDRQHRAMVDCINRLGEAIRSGETEEEVRRILSFLVLYSDTHFQEEEALMAQRDYPAQEEHRLQHQDCIHQIERLLELYRNGDRDVLTKLARFYEVWLVDHLAGSDQLLADFVRDPGPGGADGRPPAAAT